jgi:hypothetical protein
VLVVFVKRAKDCRSEKGHDHCFDDLIDSVVTIDEGGWLEKAGDSILWDPSLVILSP